MPHRVIGDLPFCSDPLGAVAAFQPSTQRFPLIGRFTQPIDLPPRNDAKEGDQEKCKPKRGVFRHDINISQCTEHPNAMVSPLDLRRMSVGGATPDCFSTANRVTVSPRMAAPIMTR